jgi:ATP-dependent Lon protease
MARDTQSKMSKKEQSKRTNNKREEVLKKKKRSEDSDSDNGDSSDSESDEMDEHEYRKFISKIFPSKHMNKKVKAGEKLKKELKKDFNEGKSNKKSKKVVSSDEEWDTEEDEEEGKVSKKSKKTKKNNKKSKKEDDEETIGSEDTEYDEDEDEEDEDYEDYEDEDEEDEDEQEIELKKGNNKVNIIFTIGGAKDEDDDEWDTEDEYDSDYEEFENTNDETEDEDESVSTDTSSEEEEEEKPKGKTTKKVVKKETKSEKKSEKKTEKKPEKKPEDNKNTDIVKEIKENADNKSTQEVLTQLKELLSKNPNDKSIQKCIEVYEEDIKKQTAKNEKKDKKHKEKNMRIFRKIIRDKNVMNDFSFYEKLDMSDQKKIIKELREINKITRIEKPYRMTLLESNIPVQFKAAAMKKINSLRYMEPGSGEFYKIKNWVDTFMRIPFGKTDGLPISIDDGVEKCHDFMENAQKILDDAVYGLNDAKMQIMQMLGQLLTNPKAIGTAIAIHGPPGTGKTSLVKEGISKILNRPFAFIALGGATDSSFLEGHGYTYEGSTWGKIVQILIDSNCMNPVIYFDELDKISDTPRGEEIAGILTHLTDTSQNSQFHDKYFAEINFDLSKCLFIFSYNDESKVNPILKDRMYRIKTKGYSQKEKTVISNNYLLPRIKEQVKFKDGEIIIPDATISHIIETHCQKEDGVRNLKRCLEIIYTKLNLYRLMRPGSNLFEGEMSLKVEFPFTVTKDIVDKLIKKEQENLSALYAMYV